MPCSGRQESLPGQPSQCNIFEPDAHRLINHDVVRCSVHRDFSRDKFAQFDDLAGAQYARGREHQITGFLQ